LRLTIRVACALALATIAFAPRNAAAAGTEVTPFVGIIAPTQNLMTGPSALYRMGDHSVYGLTIGRAVAERFGVELALGAGSGHLEAIGGDAFEFGSTVLIADLRGRFRLAGDASTSLGLVVGGAYTNYKVGYFDFAEDQLDEDVFDPTFGGVAGLDVRAGLSDRLALTVTALDRFHGSGVNTDSEALGTEIEDKSQHDFMFTAGLKFELP